MYTHNEHHGYALRLASGSLCSRVHWLRATVHVTTCKYSTMMITTILLLYVLSLSLLLSLSLSLLLLVITTNNNNHNNDNNDINSLLLILVMNLLVLFWCQEPQSRWLSMVNNGNAHKLMN